jgi:tetratricopeptide (TPR) repeat protein
MELAGKKVVSVSQRELSEDEFEGNVVAQICATEFQAETSQFGKQGHNPMKSDRLPEDDFSCSGSETCLQELVASPESLNPQATLLLEPSPEEARQVALKTALENYRKAVVEKPDCAWTWYQYGDALLELKRADEALPALRKAVKLSPDTALFHYDLGLALYDLDESEAAREEFAQIVANDPKLKCAWSSLMLSAMTNLALSQEKLGQRDEAIQTLLPALDTAVGILFNLGFLHFRAKRFDAALPYAHAACVLKPNNEDIVHQYGAILSELKRPREAVKILKQATGLNPACGGAWYDLGLAYVQLKQRKLARRCFLKSLAIDPHCAWSHYDLACLDALEGNREAAFDNLRQAVACGFRKCWAYAPGFRLAVAAPRWPLEGFAQYHRHRGELK